MKEKKTTDQNFFQEIMAKSKLELPFLDFEDNVMFEIEKKILHQASFSKELKLSWFFFIAGTVLGIVISLILPQMQKSILGFRPDKFTIIFQVVFALLFFIQVDMLTKFNKRV
jgi:hypothetical protein